MKEDAFEITDHLFEDVINIVFTDDINKSIKNQCKILKISPKKYVVDNANAVCCWVNEKKVSGIWVLFDINNITPGIILHESVHVAYDVMSRRGIEHSKSTDEVYAYYTQWLFKKITEYYNSIKS